MKVKAVWVRSIVCKFARSPLGLMVVAWVSLGMLIPSDWNGPVPLPQIVEQLRTFGYQITPSKEYQPDEKRSIEWKWLTSATMNNSNRRSPSVRASERAQVIVPKETTKTALTGAFKLLSRIKSHTFLRLGETRCSCECLCLYNLLMRTSVEGKSINLLE